jgi:hypothetical protein
MLLWWTGKSAKRGQHDDFIMASTLEAPQFLHLSVKEILWLFLNF